MLQRVFTRVSKPAARYSDRGSMAEHCSACRFFMSGGDCARVLGRVLPQGWCKYFSREAVQRWNPLWPMEVIPAPPGATLDLSFLTSGALDPRITFTRASTATYFNSVGVMQTAAANAPRWDYNPSTLQLNGLLIEEARTNLVLQSSNCASASWQNNAVTIVQGIAGAPDGTASFNRVVETATTSFHYAGQTTITVAASTTYVLSVFGQAAENRYLQISLDDGGADGGYATFDLLAGTITQPMVARGTGVVGAANIQPIGGGIYRCSIVTTAGPGSAIGRALFLMSNSPTPPFAPSYPGNTSNGLLLWGAQLEQGAFPTSLIPTTAAAVTRAIDAATMPITGWLTPLIGTLVAECILPTVQTTQTIACLDDGSLNNIIRTYCTPGNVASAQLVAAGSNFYNPGIGTIVPGAITKTGLAYQAAYQISAFNGALTGSNTLASVPAGLTRLDIGGISGATQPLDGYIRRISYWPRVLSNAEMQQVTT